MELLSVVSAYSKPGSVIRHERSRTISSALLLVTHGKITYRIDDRTILLQQGDMLYLPVDTLRSAESDPELAFHRITLLFHETPDTEELSVLHQHRNRQINSVRYEYIKQRLLQVNEAWMDKSPYYESICSGIVTEVFGLLQQELLAGAAARSVTNNIVAQAKQYMLRHYREKVLVSEIADHVSRTPNYLTAIFKSETGKSPKEYLNHLRIGVAVDLLLSTEMTIGEISDYLGFCDQAYFNHIFRKITGNPPSSMLKMMKDETRTD